MKTLAGIAVGAVLLVIFSCSNEGDGFLARLLKGSGGGVPVTVESVAVRERQREAAFPARAETAETVDVSVPEEAIVASVSVTEGQPVSAGTELLRLSTDDLNTKLTNLRMDLRDAQARFDRDSYFARNKDRLLAEGRMDQAQFDNIDAELERDSAALEKLKADQAKLEERIASPFVASPIPGVVSKINIAPGLAATAGSPLMSIAKSDQLSFSFRIPPSFLPSASAGQGIRIRFPESGETVQARITSVAAEADPADGSYVVKAAASAAKQNQGAGAEALLSTPEKQRVFVVPEEALIRDRSAVFVFTVEKRTAHKIQVIPSDTMGNQVEIARGLKEDDTVVVRGQDKLSEGTVVDIWKR